MMLHILSPLVLLLVELVLDTVDVLLRLIAIFSQLFQLDLHRLQLMSILSDRGLQESALLFLLELCESNLLVHCWSLFNFSLRAKLWVGFLFCLLIFFFVNFVWLKCLGFGDHGFLLFRKFNLVHWLGSSWRNS